VKQSWKTRPTWIMNSEGLEAYRYSTASEPKCEIPAKSRFRQVRVQQVEVADTSVSREIEHTGFQLLVLLNESRIFNADWRCSGFPTYAIVKPSNDRQ
jgi:hypothetical protein